jgi:ketosteroid isomerase-like protein
MRKTNVEVVRALYDAWNRHDLRASSRLLDDEIEFCEPSEWVHSGTYRGIAAMGEALLRQPDAWEDFQMEVEELTERGDECVLAVVRERGRGRHSGIEVDESFFHLWTIHDGMATRLQVFMAREQAVAARAAGFAVALATDTDCLSNVAGG